MLAKRTNRGGGGSAYSEVWVNRIVSIVGAFALAACNSSMSERHDGDTGSSANKVQATEPQPPIPPPQTGPDARTPLAEPKGPIDPKSAEAAGQVVQHYGALIEQGRWIEAAHYWRQPNDAASFAKQLQASALAHLEIGKPGESEGAAGSIYMTMPVVFYNDRLRRPADVILRRVNDVPGSTEDQRHWHIERIEWKPMA
jgi:hypothetical protein